MFLKINHPSGSTQIIDNISSFNEHPCEVNEHGGYIPSGGYTIPKFKDSPFKFITYVDSSGDDQCVLIFVKSYLCADNGETLHVIDPRSGIICDEKHIDNKLRHSIGKYLEGKEVVSVADILRDVFGEAGGKGGPNSYDTFAEKVIKILESKGWAAGGRKLYSKWHDYVSPKSHRDVWSDSILTGAVLEAAASMPDVTIDAIMRAIKISGKEYFYRVQQILKINGYTPRLKVLSGTRKKVWGKV